MSTNKLIREGRLGPPKCWKTGAVVTTYPQPLLCIQMDQNGMDIVNGPMTKITPDELVTICKTKKREDLKGISYVDVCDYYKVAFGFDLDVPKNSNGFQAIAKCVTALTTGTCPYRTVVIDSVTAMQKMVLSYIADKQPQQLADARKWASTIGGKIDQVITCLTNMPDTHVVVLMHEDTDKNEITGEIQTLPMIYSKLKLFTGGLFSQFFYQKMEGGKPVLFTQANGFIKGIGARWPDFTGKPKIGVTFQDIYGKEVS